MSMRPHIAPWLDRVEHAMQRIVSFGVKAVNLTQTIVDELNGFGHCPSTGESGARTNWVMDQLLEEYYRQS